MENEPDIPMEDVAEPEDVGLYPRSAAEERAARISSLVFLFVALLVSVHTSLVVFGIISPCSAGEFARMFQGMKLADLPLITRIVISPVFIWGLPALTVAVIVKEFVVRNKTATLIANGAFFCLAVVVRYLYLPGIFAPLFELLGRMSEG